MIVGLVVGCSTWKYDRYQDPQSRTDYDYVVAVSKTEQSGNNPFDTRYAIFAHIEIRRDSKGNVFLWFVPDNGILDCNPNTGKIRVVWTVDYIKPWVSEFTCQPKRSAFYKLSDSEVACIAQGQKMMIEVPIENGKSNFLLDIQGLKMSELQYEVEGIRDVTRYNSIFLAP